MTARRTPAPTPGATTPGAATGTGPDDLALTDLQIAARIRPLLAACALGLVPFTVYSTFLVDIVRDSGQDPVLMGWLRGTGGVAALVVGLCCAPLLDRVSRGVAAAGALLVLALACALGTLGSAGAWAAFCLLVGAGTSVLNPAVSAMAADRFRDEATSGRAATQVSATMTLTAVLAAPLLAGPAVLWGWRGDLLATALLAVLTAALLWRRTRRGTGSRPTTPPAHRTGYLAGLRVVRDLPGVPAMLLVSALRTTAFMGQLAYLSVVYFERFALGAGVFSLVWTLSGVAFFLGNWFGGRLLRSLHSSARAAWIACGAALVGAPAVLLVFTTTHLVVALTATALLGASHAVRRRGDHAPGARLRGAPGDGARAQRRGAEPGRVPRGLARGGRARPGRVDGSGCGPRDDDAAGRRRGCVRRGCGRVRDERRPGVAVRARPDRPGRA